jgi:hypothetical protein
MAESKKTVVFEGRDQGLGSTMDKIRRKSEDSTRQMIQEARQYTTSGKEALRYLEDELKLLEKINVTNREADRLQLQRQKEAALGKKGSDPIKVEKQFAGREKGVEKEAEDSKMQISLMREMIETIKSTARTGVMQDQKGVERMLKKSKSIGRKGLGEDADEFDALKETLQEMIIGEKDDAEKTQKGQFRAAAGKGGRMFNAGAGVGVQANEMYMAAGALAMVPFIGQGLSQLASKALGEAERLQTAKTGVAGITGYLPTTDNIDASKYGKTQAEFYQMMPSVYRSAGLAGNTRMGMEMLAMERGGGIDQGTSSEFLRMSVRGAGFKNLDDPTQILVDTLQSEGLLGPTGKNLALLPEFMQQQIVLMKDQIVATGTANVGRTAAYQTDLSKIFATPEQREAVMGAAGGTFRNPSNEYTQAFQTQMIGKMLRGRGETPTMARISRFQDNPANDPLMMLAHLEQSMSMSSNLDEMQMQMENRAGLRPNQAYQLSKYFKEKGTVDPDFLKGTGGYAEGEGRGGKPKIDFDARAEAFVGVMEKSTAKISDIFAGEGESLVSSAQDVIDAFKKLREHMQEKPKSKVPLGNTVNQMRWNMINMAWFGGIFPYAGENETK